MEKLVESMQFIFLHQHLDLVSEFAGDTLGALHKGDFQGIANCATSKERSRKNYFEIIYAFFHVSFAFFVKFRVLGASQRILHFGKGRFALIPLKISPKKDLSLIVSGFPEAMVPAWMTSVRASEISGSGAAICQQGCVIKMQCDDISKLHSAHVCCTLTKYFEST